ncbi:MAG: leucine-rich repeat domain-containing protein [Candidatus Thiodiazotropha sp.]
MDLYDNLIVDATFPSSFKHSSQKLSIILGQNRIKAIDNFTFVSLANKNLSKVYLRQNEIETIEENAFAALRSISALNLCQNHLHIVLLKNVATKLIDKSLKSLDLSNISLLDFPIQKCISYMEYSSLKILRLRSYNLRKLHSNIFSQLQELTELDLSKNKIWFVAKNAFNGLYNLKTLNLDDNALPIAICPPT